MRYELTDFEWTAIKPFLPNKPRGDTALWRAVARFARVLWALTDQLPRVQMSAAQSNVAIVNELGTQWSLRLFFTSRMLHARYLTRSKG